MLNKEFNLSKYFREYYTISNMRIRGGKVKKMNVLVIKYYNPDIIFSNSLFDIPSVLRHV